MPEAATSQQPETMGVTYRMPTHELHPYPSNPFGVRDDPEIQELVDNVQNFGVLVSAIARSRPDGGFALISGRRRKHPSELLYLQKLESVEHFKAELIDYINYYNNRRIKEKRKGLPSALHRQQALSAA